MSDAKTLLKNLVKAYLLKKYFEFHTGKFLKFEEINVKKGDWVFTTLDIVQTMGESEIKYRDKGWIRLVVLTSSTKKYANLLSIIKKDLLVDPVQIMQIIIDVLWEVKYDAKFRNEVSTALGEDAGFELYYLVENEFVNNNIEDLTMVFETNSDNYQKLEKFDEYILTNDQNIFTDYDMNLIVLKPKPKKKLTSSTKKPSKQAPKVASKKQANETDEQAEIRRQKSNMADETVQNVVNFLVNKYNHSKTDEARIINHIMIATGKAVSKSQMKSDTFNLTSTRLVKREDQKSSKMVSVRMNSDPIFPGGYINLAIDVKNANIKWFDDPKRYAGINIKRTANNNELSGWITDTVIPLIWSRFANTIKTSMGVQEDIDVDIGKSVDEKIKDLNDIDTNKTESANVAFGELKTKREELSFMPRFAAKLPILPDSDLDQIGGNIMSIKGQKERVVTTVLELERGKDFTPLEIIARNTGEMFSELSNDDKTTLQKVREELVLGDENIDLNQPTKQKFINNDDLDEAEDDFIANEK